MEQSDARRLVGDLAHLNRTVIGIAILVNPLFETHTLTVHAAEIQH